VNEALWGAEQGVSSDTHDEHQPWTTSSLTVRVSAVQVAAREDDKTDSRDNDRAGAQDGHEGPVDPADQDWVGAVGVQKLSFAN
jgi:hypothetical protein